MDQKQIVAGKLEIFRFGKQGAGAGTVYISPDRRHRCNFLQPVHDLDISNISGVQNVIGPAQGLHCFRAKQSMRIGYDADLHG